MPPSRRRCSCPSVHLWQTIAQRCGPASRDGARRAQGPVDACGPIVADWATGATGCRCGRDVVVLRAVRAAPGAGAAGRSPRLGGWMPRIETTRTLAASLGPPPTAARRELASRLGPRHLARDAALSRRAWGGDWPRRDPRGFAQACGAGRSDGARADERAAGVAPDARDRWWQRARELLRCRAPVPAGHENACSRGSRSNGPRARSSAGATDRLFDASPRRLGRGRAPAAAIRSPMRCSRDGDAPALRIDADVDPARPFASRARSAPYRPTQRSATASRTRRRAAAAQVLVHVGRGETPVALIALDRALVRRVRALLERAAASSLRDETGWKLVDDARRRDRDGAAARGSPRRQRRRVARLAEVARRSPDGARSARSKRSTPPRAGAGRRGVAADAPRLGAAATALRAEATAIVDALARPSRRSLVDWLDALRSSARPRRRARRGCATTPPAARRSAALGVDPPLAPGAARSARAPTSSR